MKIQSIAGNKVRTSLLAVAVALSFSCTTKEEGNESKAELEGKAKFVKIFDGKSMKGWEGDTRYWRVENGTLVGEITPDKPLEKNSFLIWSGGQPADFEFKAMFKISESGNSGVNYRSDKVTDVPFALKGYQADIDGKNNYTGQNYEERKRTTLAYRGEAATISSQPNASDPESMRANIQRNAWQTRNVTRSLGAADELKSKIKSGDWNEIRIVAKGNKLEHYINGVLMSEVLDEDTVNRSNKGFLGLQIHTGPPMKVEYKDIVIKNY